MKARGTFYRKRRGHKITFLMMRDGYDCAICDEPLDRHLGDPAHPGYITFDHIRPCSLGGTDRIDNLRLAHRRCNELRGNDPIMPEEESGEGGR